MTLTEITGVPQAALPLAQLKDHLRMGAGFSDDAVQDSLLEGYLRAALAAVEGRTGKALIARDFRWTVGAWRDNAEAVLPVAPVTSVVSLTVKDRAGAATVIAASAYLLVADGVRPVLAGAGTSLPTIPSQGSAEVVFTAGFGAWAAVPPDLGQAAMLLAAHYHENRFGSGETAGRIPYGIEALLSRWVPLRITGGV
jgi:uncharacterized phiE125 gp8 family phage protein